MKTFSFNKVGLVVIILVLGVLTACGNKDSEEDAEGKVSFSMMHYYNKELNEPAPMAQIEKLAEFNEQNPDVKIVEEMQSHDNYETKIKTLAAGNELPDLFLIKGSMTKVFADNGQILKLNDFLDEKEGWEEQFVDGTLTPFQLQDDTYGIPISGGATHLVYYNKDLFAEAGIEEFPTTWDGFMEAIDKLNAADITPIALGNKGKWVLNSSYISTLANRYTGSEWFEDIFNQEGDAKFTDPEFVEALETLKDLTDNDAFNSNMNSIDNSEQQAMYMSGKAAMFIEGDWAAGTITNDAPEDIVNATEIAIFPEIEGAAAEQNTVSGGGGWAYAINANVSDEKLAEIKKAIYHLADMETATMILEKGQIPALKVENADEMDIPELTKKILNVVDNNQYVPIYDTVLSPTLIAAMNTNLQNLTIGQVTPEEAAKNIQQAYETESK